MLLLSMRPATLPERKPARCSLFFLPSCQNRVSAVAQEVPAETDIRIERGIGQRDRGQHLIGRQLRCHVFEIIGYPQVNYAGCVWCKTLQLLGQLASGERVIHGYSGYRLHGISAVTSRQPGYCGGRRVEGRSRTRRLSGLNVPRTAGNG